MWECGNAGNFPIRSVGIYPAYLGRYRVTKLPTKVVEREYPE
jgi:hypothetical protein